jgi:DNA polymerase
MVEEACAFLREASRKTQGKLSLSPETAEMVERLESSGAAKTSKSSKSVKPSKPEVTLEPIIEKQAADLESTKFSGPISTPMKGGLETLEAIVRECKLCTLSETRTQTVFGSGNPEARLVFVGEAPGRDEDLQGKPFVGRAGQLLTDIIEKGMNLQRSEVFICNVLKCRPPENRNPLPNEIDLCEPYLIRQLEIIRPRVICALGTYAAKTLLKTDETIGKLRGRWHFYHGIPLRATYHPAYLLRNPADKRKTWDDVLEVLKVYKGEFTPKPGA